MNDKLNDAVIQGVKDTFSTALDYNVTNDSPEEKTINSNNFELSVIIGFAGSISGAFILKCNRTLAAGIASKMLGCDIDENSDDVKDAMGEILNMTIGTAKTVYSPNEEAFKISVPTTISGNDYTIHVKAESSEKVSLISFKAADDDFCLEICLK